MMTGWVIATVLGALLVALAAVVVAVVAVRRQTSIDPAELRAPIEDVASTAIARAFGETSTQLQQLNEERLRSHHESTESTTRAAREAIEKLVDPLRSGVDKLDAKVRELEQERARAYAELRGQVQSTTQLLEQLRTSTTRLDSAMRRNDVRGQWGELQLQRVVELAGLKEHVSYVQQVQQQGDGSGRPDMTVHLTDGKVLYVDAKAPMAAFLDALDEPDPARQREHLTRHARDLMKHVEELGRRGYVDDGASIGLMALFVPNEASLAAALEADPELLNKALTRRIAVTGPTSLAMMLTNISASWRQQQFAENAERIVAEVRELHDRLRKFSEHFARVGTQLDRSVSAYNDAVGSFETRLLPSARRVESLEVLPSDRRIDDLDEVERRPRHLASTDTVPELPDGDEASGASNVDDTPAEGDEGARN
jgi:DNA recombination protein RmuC